MCREKGEWERVSRKWSSLWIQQCPLGPSVPCSPLWWWVQPCSLPKSLFYAPSLAGWGYGGVSSCHMFWSWFVGHQGSALGSYKANASGVKCPICDLAGTVCTCLVTHRPGRLLQEVSRPELKLCLFLQQVSNKGQGFLQQLSPQSGCVRHILQILLTLSLQMQIWSISPYKMNQWNCWRCLWETGFSCSTNEFF